MAMTGKVVVHNYLGNLSVPDKYMCIRPVWARNDVQPFSWIFHKRSSWESTHPLCMWFLDLGKAGVSVPLLCCDAGKLDVCIRTVQ